MEPTYLTPQKIAIAFRIPPDRAKRLGRNGQFGPEIPWLGSTGLFIGGARRGRFYALDKVEAALGREATIYDLTRAKQTTLLPTKAKREAARKRVALDGAKQIEAWRERDQQWLEMYGDLVPPPLE